MSKPAIVSLPSLLSEDLDALGVSICVRRTFLEFNVDRCLGTRTRARSESSLTRHTADSDTSDGELNYRFSFASSCSSNVASGVPNCDNHPVEDVADVANDVPGTRTTLMLRNLPSCYLRAQLMDLLNNEGFVAEYDFVHVPMDCFSSAGLGYAFVNMCSDTAAERVIAKLHGFTRWISQSQKVLNVFLGEEQGRNALIARYRNSRMMHSSVSAELKPLLLKNGIPQPFPPPTKRIAKPRCVPVLSGHV